MTPSASELGLPRFDPQLDHFARLGVPCAAVLDRDVLETAYLERSRAVHPDRYASADVSTQRRAQEHASALNEAYATLRDEVRRAEYLLKLAGIDLDRTEDAPVPPQALLIEMIEIREELAERAAEGSHALDEMQATIEDRADERLAQAVQALQGGQVAIAAERLVEHRYLRRLLEEIESALSS